MYDGLAAAHDLALNKICSNWIFLKSVDPENALLKYVSKVNPPHHSLALDFDNESWPEFIDKFSNPPQPKGKVFSDYAQALEVAIKSACQQKGLDPNETCPAEAKKYF